MKVLKPLLVIVFLLLMVPVAVLGRPDWNTLKTDRFIVFYPAGHENDAWQVLRSLEYFRPQIERLTGNVKTYRFPVVIDDTGTYMNGFSYPLDNQVHLFRYNPEWWAGIENWWSLVGVHEYTHQLSLGNSNGNPAVLKNIFGLHPLGMSNLFIPGWITEGIAVYSESRLSPLQGRLNDGLFDAYIGARAEDERLPTILDATFEPLEFQLDGHYTYGSQFCNYLAQIYGEDKFAQFFTVNGGSEWFWLPFPALGIDRSAQKVYGKSFRQLWQEWWEYEKTRRPRFIVNGTQITHTGWNKAGPRISGDKLYYNHATTVKTGAFQTFRDESIVEQDLTSGKEKAIITVASGFSTPLRVKNGLLYYGVNEQKPGYANSIKGSYGFYTVLRQYNLNTGKDRAILEAGLRAFDILENGQLLYSQDKAVGFGSEIYLFDPVVKSVKLLMQTDYLVNEIAAGGGRVIVSARKDWESFGIYLLNLENGQFTPLINTPYMEGGLSVTGEKLFFTANFNKVYAIYCYDFTTAKVFQVTDAGFAQSPVCDETNQQLYFVGLNSEGYDIYRISPELKEYKLPEISKTAVPDMSSRELAVKEGNYNDNLATLIPKSWWPLLFADNQVKYAGVGFRGCDAIGDFRYNAGLAYDFAKQKIVFQADVVINYLAPLEIRFLHRDFGLDTTWFTYNPGFEKITTLDIAFPLVSKLSGFADLRIGYSINFWGETMEPQYQPYIAGGFSYPKTRGGWRLSLPYSQTNGINHRGSYLDLNLKQYLPGGQLSLFIRGMNDPDNPETVFTPVGGHDQPLNDNRGVVCSLEYSRPLFKIRNGFWNPNVYFEDLTGTVFMYHATAFKGERQISWGTEVHLETKAFYNGMQLDWGVRWTQNMEGRDQVAIFAQFFY